MSATATEIAPVIRFEVPGGELRFAEGDLDKWAEHLVWCYELLGIGAGATIAVQDFGTSPLAYLGSALLMPTLEAGVAERLDAQIICLDASPERIVITPDAIRQVGPDVLIVRADVLGLLLDGSKRVGVDLVSTAGLDLVVAVGIDSPPLPKIESCKRILHVEPTLLLAPECGECGCFHLREGVYTVRDGHVVNLLLDSAAPCDLGRLEVVDETCQNGPADTLVRLGAGGRGSR